MEYTDGTLKYKVEKIGEVLKNEPIPVSINPDMWTHVQLVDMGI